MGRPQGRHPSPRGTGAIRSCRNSPPTDRTSPPVVLVETLADPWASSPESLLQAALAAPTSRTSDPQFDQGQLDFGAGGIYSTGLIDFSNMEEARDSISPVPRTNPTSVQPCGCVASICGALESLSNLPCQFEAAIRTARLASRAVYEVFECPQCGISAAQLTESRHTPRFHMVVMCASVFPVLVAAYQKVLTLADAEVAEAEKSGRQLSFQLGRYGGLWGPVSRGNRKCEQYYEDLTVDTNTWRSTIKALLRADVHGSDLLRSVEEGIPPYHHKGLWDFVQGMSAMSASPEGDRKKRLMDNCSAATTEEGRLALHGGSDAGVGDGADLDVAISLAHRSLLKLAI